MKVLIIPSWYPTLRNPLSGTFFREQALLMEPECDIRVLVVHPYYYNLRRLSKKMPKNRAIERPLVIEAYKGLINCIHKRNVQRKLLLTYHDCFNGLLKQGWLPDIIHAHSAIWGGYYAVHIGKAHGIPTMITEPVGPFLLHEFTKDERADIKWSFENADRIACVSNHQMRSVLMHNFRCDPIVTGNYVDDEMFFISPKKARIFSILTVGGTEWYKDIYTFLKAIVLFKERVGDNFVARIVCLNKKDLFEVKQYCSKNSILENCDFLIQIPRENMPNIIQDSDVFVSTSIAETFGVSMVEALMCGKPVISTKNGGAEDFVNIKNGYLVNLRDSTAISDHLLSMFKNGFHSNPEQIRNTVVNKYGRVAFKKMTLSIYESLLKPEGIFCT